MSKEKIVALVRVSTDKQTVENQVHAINNEYPNCEILWFKENDTSGAKKFRNRPILQDAIKTAKRLKCPLVVYSLSRLGRTYEVGQFLEDTKINVHAMDTPNLDDAIAGFHVAINRLERLTISARTRTALARLKAQGKDLGNLTNLAEVRVRGHETSIRNANEYAKNIKEIIEGIRQSGIKTLSGLANALNNRGVKTYQDKTWYPTTVKNVLERGL